MAEQQRVIEFLGIKLTVVDVGVKTATEPDSIYELEDGTKMRVKSVANIISRVVGQNMPDGRPVYLITTNPVVTVTSSPFWTGPMSPQPAKPSPSRKRK